VLRTADSRGRLSPHFCSKLQTEKTASSLTMRPFPFRKTCYESRAYTLKDDPQPQVLFTFGFSNLKPAPSRVST
jgi:hypothetical protein